MALIKGDREVVDEEQSVGTLGHVAGVKRALTAHSFMRKLQAWIYVSRCSLDRLFCIDSVI